MNQQMWKATLDTRTLEMCGVIPERPFLPKTMIPVRRMKPQGFLATFLGFKPKYETVWIDKGPIRIRMMTRKTINCRCAMAPIVEAQSD